MPLPLAPYNAETELRTVILTISLATALEEYGVSSDQLHFLILITTMLLKCKDKERFNAGLSQSIGLLRNMHQEKSAQQNLQRLIIFEKIRKKFNDSDDDYATKMFIILLLRAIITKATKEENESISSAQGEPGSLSTTPHAQNEEDPPTLLTLV